MHEDEDEDDKPFVRPASRKEPLRKGVIKPLMTKTLHLWFFRELRDLLRPHSDKRKKGPLVWQDPTAILEQDVSRDSRERTEETSILRKKK